MPAIRLVLAALLVFLSAPVTVRLRVRLRSADAGTSEMQQMTAAIRRGFYSDTSLIAVPETLGVRTTFPLDSATRRRVGRAMLLDGSVEKSGELVEVRMQLLDILMKPVTPLDTVRVKRTEVDSALAAAGHRYASAIARQFGNRRPWNER